MIEIIPNTALNLPNILVIGIGGAGGNAVGRMYTTASTLHPDSPVQYAVLNTDLQALSASPVSTTLQLGSKLTQGFGAGADSSIGEAAAVESLDEIAELISNANMVILTCGLGGGTGSGAIPVIAGLCREKGLLTVAVVTTPFTFESRPRSVTAQASLAKLTECVDTLLVIPNDKLLSLSNVKGKAFCLEDAFDIADGVLKDTIFSITNIIYHNGLINLDFNDLCAVLKNKGMGHIGIGYSNEKTSLADALQQAIQSPLLDTTISGASHILLNTAGRVDLGELNEAVNHVRQLAGESVNIIWGTVTDGGTDPDQVVITLIATGMTAQDTIPALDQTEPKKGTVTAPPYTVEKVSSSGNISVPDIRPIQSKYPSSYRQSSNTPKASELHSFKIPSFLDRYHK